MKTPPPADPSSRPIDSKWTWHRARLLELREKLRESQLEHEKAAATPFESQRSDVGENAQEQTDHEILLAELHAEADRMNEIEGALLRIQNGTYGRCEETGASISPARLRAIPWTRYSRAAADRHSPAHNGKGPLR